MNRSEFVFAALAAARKSSATSGLWPGVTVAQAALESGWGESQLSLQANNYFGIKAHGRSPMAEIEFPTWESINGQMERVIARFAKYESMAECFKDRDRILTTLSCYRLVGALDAEGSMKELAKHWATDPQYAEKLIGIYRAQGLYKSDEEWKKEGITK